MSEKLSTTRNSDELCLSEFVRHNQSKFTLTQLQCNRIQRINNMKLSERISNQEKLNADSELENSLSSLGVLVNEKEIQKTNDRASEVEEDISSANKIKNYKEELSKQGKPQTEILQLLIAKFEGNDAVVKWVENWRNFRRLHQFAENKPPKECKVIQNIIGKADFSDENAFTTSLIEIANSSDISSTTKLELSKQFGADVFTVDAMDFQLKEIKAYTKAIEQEIEVKSSEKKSLDLEIENLKDEISKLPLDDPKRLELENELLQRKKSLEGIGTELVRLERRKPKDVSFQLREGFNAVQNPDGSRSIKITDSNFAIRLPSNALPFTDTKNLRAINVAFPFAILKEQNLAGFLFRPNLEDNDIPSKGQRNIAGLILSSLGYDTSKILSKNDIEQLKKDLSSLNSRAGRTGEENLIELGVFNVNSRSLNIGRLKEVLGIIRENNIGNETALFGNKKLA